MSETADPDANIANHTPSLLRRFDKRMDQLTELFVRQQDLTGRLDRNMQEGFSASQRDVAILRRDVRELKSDIVLMENRIVSALAADHFAGARLNEHEVRLEALERGSRPAV